MSQIRQDSQGENAKKEDFVDATQREDSPEPQQQRFAPSQFQKGRRKIDRKDMDMSQRLDYALKCDQMGYIKQSLHQYTVIDFCLDDILRIDWTCSFINLRELTCANQGIVEIEGIDKCRFLEKVWLNNNNIEAISCVDRLLNLKLLCLSSNKIKRLRCLEKCQNLEKLWLDDNRIECLDNLNSLTNLLELNLAQNFIENIGVGLDGLSNLRDVNLSANRIGNFKEVLNLNRLPSLQSCSFSDFNYGENPICTLCNYQTFVLFHLPKIIRLDTNQITDESKSFAETTFMKKRMYYNMRIKTIQRNTSNIMKLLKICRNVRKRNLDLQVSKLIKKLQEIQRELDERRHISSDNKAEFESVRSYGPQNLKHNPLDEIDNETLVSDIESKRALIQGRLHDRDEDFKDLQVIYESMIKKIYDMSEQNIHRLMTELDTGGNIRFEEGRLQDKWYTSCVDLVRSRFNAEQMKPFGIIGINVNRVTRIHNRFLRNRFEEKLELLVDLSDSQYKRNLEYLFYGFNPQAPKEIHRAVEEGFRSPSDYEDAGMPSCVGLVNSVASAESAKINYFLKAEDGTAQMRSAAKREKQADLRANQEVTIEKGLVQIPTGQILVCKIFLQKCVHDSKCPHFNPAHSPNEIWSQNPLDYKHHPNIQSVYRTKENDSKQRLWFVLDNALALPEYLVEFDYITSPGAVAENKRLSEAPILNEECNHLFKGVMETQRVLENTLSDKHTRPQMIHLTAEDLDHSDMGCLKRPLHSLMTACHISELMENHYEFQEDEKSGAQAIENSMPPEIPLRSQFDYISEHNIVNLSRQRDLTKIVYLNLFNNKIKRITNLEGLPNLTTLIMSFNEIEEIEGLNNNPLLKKLELNHNFIRQVLNIEHLQQLQQLDLRHNWIDDVSGLDLLRTCCLNLKDLGLKLNPIASRSNYRITIFDYLHHIQRLDGQSLTDKDKERAALATKELTSEMIFQVVKSMKKYHIATQENDVEQPVNGWERSIEELNLNHLRIIKIQKLEPFTSLRKLSLLDNNIAQISGLEKLGVLEELSLEKNKLTTIQNIEQLKYLKKLELGSNQIRRISNINGLQNLTQLSLENNEISRLDGLEELQNLMELYLGNNLIADVKETIKLQDLQRLIILDISGNPMSSGAANNLNYRIYCIYHLRKLRVLDGMSIDPQEHIEAKETFSGRLTDEILYTRLNGRKLSDMKDLDLSNSKLRDFEDMFDNSKMPNLRDLNLTGNFMSSMRCFGFLPNLKALRLKQNRVITLFLKPSPEDKNFRRGLFGMPALELLDVSNNSLQYLYGLQYSPLKELKILYASGNEIVKIEHLEKLRQLRELDLSKNKIRQVETNSFLQSHIITCLKLDDNALKSIANIERLESLQQLQMSGNRISEFYELEKLGELPNLVELSFVSNPISRKPNYRVYILKRIPQLVSLDGKEITQDERKRNETLSGAVMDLKMQQQPMVHFAQYPNKQIVKLNAVNFEGIFANKNNQEDRTPLGQRQAEIQVFGQAQIPQTFQPQFDMNIDPRKAQRLQRPSTDKLNTINTQPPYSRPVPPQLKHVQDNQINQFSNFPSHLTSQSQLNPHMIGPQVPHSGQSKAQKNSNAPRVQTYGQIVDGRKALPQNTGSSHQVSMQPSVQQSKFAQRQAPF